MGHTRIASVFTKSTFLHFEDALEISKVRLFAGSYKRGEGMQEHITHYMDADTALVLAFDLLLGNEATYKEYKGSQNNGDVRARVLKVDLDTDKVFFDFAEGPGELMDTGAIKMAGEPEVRINAPSDKAVARRIGARLFAYLLQHANFGVPAEDAAKSDEGYADEYVQEPEFDEGGAEPRTEGNGEKEKPTPVTKGPDAPATERQMNLICRILSGFGYVTPEVQDEVLAKSGYSPISELTKAEASGLIQSLKLWSRGKAKE